MSLLFRNGSAGGAARHPASASGIVIAGGSAIATTAVCVSMSVAPAPSPAAEIYYQPIIQLSTAYNNNVDLATDQRRRGEGYYADAATVVGIATPNSETSLTPRVLYQYYPSFHDLNRVEGIVNLNSRYSWERDRFNITGYFDHRSDNNAEQPVATEPGNNPGNGTTTPSTGRVNAGTTRNWFIVDPSFTHLITPLSGIGVGGEYQRLSYSPEDTSGHIPFNYYLGKVFYSWTQNPRTDFTVSAFGSRYLAGTIDSNSTTGGVNGAMKYSWTQTLQSDVSVSYERTHFKELDPHYYDHTSNEWSAYFSTVYNGQATQYRASIGRSIIPGANGGLFATDQVQAQYDRDFTQRLRFTTAIRFFRDRTISGPVGNDTRNYLTPFVKLQWMMTQRIFIAGSYSYVYQKYHTDTNSAESSRVSLTIGYTGLQRQH